MYIHRTFECSFNVLGKGCVNYSKHCTAGENPNLKDFFMLKILRICMLVLDHKE